MRQAVGSETEAVVWVSRRDRNSGGGFPWRPLLGRTRRLLVEVSVGNHIGYEAVHEGSVSERKGPHTCFLGHKGLSCCLDARRKPNASLRARGWVGDVLGPGPPEEADGGPAFFRESEVL